MLFCMRMGLSFTTVRINKPIPQTPQIINRIKPFSSSIKSELFKRNRITKYIIKITTIIKVFKDASVVKTVAPSINGKNKNPIRKPSTVK